MDGVVQDMKDFEPGVTAPPFHPWCRTTTVPYFEDDFGERAARDADGNVYYVPSNMKYGEWKEKFVDGNKKDLTKFPINDTIKLPDIHIGKSLGAKSKNYDILDLATGEMYHLAEGSRLQNVEVFAGKGVSKAYEKAWKYADKHGGKVEDWQHVKGFGLIDTADGDIPAEVHWSQCEGIGKFDFFIKRWLE
jgi:hypothetical protein